MEKYQELYRFSNQALEEEQKRFARLEDKANRYLVVLTFLVGLAVPTGKALFVELLPPTSPSAWLAVNVCVAIFCSLGFSWFLTFWVIRTQRLKTRPLNSEMIKFFKEQKEVNIYYAIAKANAAAFEENRKVNDRKGKLLTYATRWW
jgi:hypothetical protein